MGQQREKNEYIGLGGVYNYKRAGYDQCAQWNVTDR